MLRELLWQKSGGNPPKNPGEPDLAFLPAVVKYGHEIRHHFRLLGISHYPLRSR
jgi:hypothetical protein